jgi:hypothetical protein
MVTHVLHIVNATFSVVLSGLLLQCEAAIRDKRRMTMEFRESYPTMTDARQLGHVGFSREQIAGLERVKALYQREAYHEATAEYKRQAFVRWLYLQGRLES